MTVDVIYEELMMLHPFLSLAKADCLLWLVIYVIRKTRIIVRSD
jgi:hypothetical protein